MAGHSKWANIQYRKGAQDKRRDKIFNKLIREIAVAARAGGADQGANAWLRMAADKARARSITGDTIERAIKRATGGEDGMRLERVRYEGYGPGGAALLIDCLTDNRNRTVAEVRHALMSHDGKLGAAGSVSYLFNQVGLMVYPPGTDENRLMRVALDAGAEDVIAHDDGSLEVLTDPLDFETVHARLTASSLPPPVGEITERASTSAILQGEDARSMVQLIESLENLDDVQSVYSNAEIPDEVLARV